MINDQIRICEDCRQTTSGHCDQHPLAHVRGWPVSSAIPSSAPVSRLGMESVDALSDTDLDALADRLAPRIERRLRNRALARGGR